MATLNIPIQTSPHLTIQLKLSERLGNEKIPSTEEAEAIVKEWAVRMNNRCLSEAGLKCLGDYLKSNCKAQVDDFDKVLFGWHRRGQHENVHVADAFRESSEKLLSGFENTKSEIVSLVEKAMEKAPPPSSAASSKPAQPVNPPKEVGFHTKKHPSSSQQKKRPASERLSMDDLFPYLTYDSKS